MCPYRTEVLKAALRGSSSPSQSALGEMGKVKHCCFLLVWQKAEDQGFLHMFPALLNCASLSKTFSRRETVGLLASGISESWEIVE